MGAALSTLGLISFARQSSNRVKLSPPFAGRDKVEGGRVSDEKNNSSEKPEESARQDRREVALSSPPDETTRECSVRE